MKFSYSVTTVILEYFFFSKNYAFRQNIQVSFRRKEKILMKYLKLILNSPLPKCLRVHHEIKYIRLAER